MVRLLTLIFYFLPLAVLCQQVTPLELQVDYVDGVLIFQPSNACLADTCHANVKLLKEALTHITVLKPNNKGLNSFTPFKIGSTRFYLTTYHYPFSSTKTDTILRLENDSIIIHDIGADGILSDSTREYCLNKKTQQRMDWQSTYTKLVESGVCPINCFMQDLKQRGYSGYIVQLLKDGHTAIMYY